MTDPICPEKTEKTDIKKLQIKSSHLGRTVRADAWMPDVPYDGQPPALLLINDGQNMAELGLTGILHKFRSTHNNSFVTVAIHAGEDRKLEYGTAGHPDFQGLGSKAARYALFIFEELLPLIRTELGYPQFSEKIFAGFSLGGLSAMDIAWAHPHEFSKVGVFSGSLWWREIDQHDPAYDDDKHRIMHQLVRKGHYAPWLRFFFSTGTLDETNDRNNNGIIDSIDDTLDLIKELVKKGYDRNTDIHYLELADGRHDIATWSRSFPEFLEWAFPEKKM